MIRSTPRVNLEITGVYWIPRSYGVNVMQDKQVDQLISVYKMTCG